MKEKRRIGAGYHSLNKALKSNNRSQFSAVGAQVTGGFSNISAEFHALVLRSFFADECLRKRFSGFLGFPRHRSLLLGAPARRHLVASLLVEGLDRSVIDAFLEHGYA